MDTPAAVRQPFIEHIHELRGRLLWSSMFIIFGTVAGYLMRDIILDWLQSPLGQELFFSSPMGGLSFILKISLTFGVLVAIPALMYNILRFLQPAMSSSSSRFAIKTLIASLFLLVLGVGFAYYISLPATLHFLHQFETSTVQALISADRYFKFVLTYLSGFGILFQLPLLILALNNITPLGPRKLMGYQRHVIVAAFVAAAIITPTPDPINQTLMAAPMIILYEFSIFLVWFVERHKHRKPGVATAADIAIPIPDLDSLGLEFTDASEQATRVRPTEADGTGRTAHPPSTPPGKRDTKTAENVLDLSS